MTTPLPEQPLLSPQMRTSRRVFTITAEVDAHLNMSAQVQAALNELTQAFITTCQQATQRGIRVSLMAVGDHRAPGGAWEAEQPIALAGGNPLPPPPSGRPQ